MKKIFINAMIAVMTAAMLASCDKAGPDTGSVVPPDTPSEQELPEMLSITLLRVTDTGVVLKCESVSEDSTYYLRVGPAEEVEGLIDEEVQAFDAQFFVEEAAALDMTLEEYLSLRLDRGTVSVALGNLEPGAGYCAYGYGLTADGTVTSVMERRPFVTLSSDEPFVTVSFGSIGPDEAEVTFTPADDEITYVFDIRPAEDYLAMSDAECIEDIISAGVSEDMIRTGEYTHVFDGLTPETEYIVFAFGYDVPSGQTITSLARELFESTSGMLPDFSIEVRVENITPSSADISFIPSDKNASYFYDVLPAAAYEGMSDSEVIEAALGAAGESGLLYYYLTSGDESFSQALVHDRDYVAYAFAYDYFSGGAASGLFRHDFTSGHSDVPQFSVEIEVGEITSDMATVIFRGSDEETPYFFYLAKSAELAGLSGDALVEQALSLPGYAGSWIERGEFEYSWEVNPGTEYTAVAFGYDSDIVTTDPFSRSFTTPEWEDPSLLFRIETDNLTATSVDVRIIPADKEMDYFTDIVPSAGYDGLSDDEVTEKLIEEAWYFYSDYGIMDYPYTGLTPGTDYTVYVFGCDEYTEERTTPLHSLRLHTPNE